MAAAAPTLPPGGSAQWRVLAAHTAAIVWRLCCHRRFALVSQTAEGCNKPAAHTQTRGRQHRALRIGTRLRRSGQQLPGLCCRPRPAFRDTPMGPADWEPQPGVCRPSNCYHSNCGCDGVHHGPIETATCTASSASGRAAAAPAAQAHWGTLWCFLGSMVAQACAGYRGRLRAGKWWKSIFAAGKIKDVFAKRLGRPQRHRYRRCLGWPSRIVLCKMGGVTVCPAQAAAVWAS